MEGSALVGESVWAIGLSNKARLSLLRCSQSSSLPCDPADSQAVCCTCICSELRGGVGERLGKVAPRPTLPEHPLQNPRDPELLSVRESEVGKVRGMSHPAHRPNLPDLRPQPLPEDGAKATARGWSATLRTVAKRSDPPAPIATSRRPRSGAPALAASARRCFARFRSKRRAVQRGELEGALAW